MKLLYIDDDDISVVSTFIERIENSNDQLHIGYKQVNTWDNIVESITDAINSQHIDGLILDWQLSLSGFLTSEGTKKLAKYKAAEIAQFVRRSIGEGELKKDIPIFVWSMEDKFKESYENDKSSHDLFDQIYLKTQISNNPSSISDEILAFNDAYQQSRNALTSTDNNLTYSDFLFFLSIDEDQDFGVDGSIFDYLLGIENKISARALVRFIYKEIIKKAGLLISEDLLAIRLGVERFESSDWENLLYYLDKFKYKGLFSNTNSVYWSKGIYDFWAHISPKLPELSLIDVNKRVNILKETFNLTNLIPIQPTEKNSSIYYWNRCKKTNIPIDPDDSIMIREQDPLPWQERNYISFYAAKNKLGLREGLVPHIIEQYKLEI